MTTPPRLAPSDGPLYVVRWIRLDGRDARHRYFRRRHDAEAFQQKLVATGRDTRLFQTSTAWVEVES